jgi:hypothetical protein
MVKCALGLEGLCGPKLPEVCRVICRVASCPMLNIAFIKKSTKLFKKCFLFGFDVWFDAYAGWF